MGLNCTHHADGVRAADLTRPASRCSLPSTGLSFMNRGTSDARVKESALKGVVIMSRIPRLALAYAEAVKRILGIGPRFQDPPANAASRRSVSRIVETHTQVSP